MLWERVIRSWWHWTNLDGLLGQLCNYPNAEALIPLRPALRIPEGYTIQGKKQDDDESTTVCHRGPQKG